MTDRPSTASTPGTEAGRALVEWAENAYPGQDQVRIWREHVLLIEEQARARALPPTGELLQPFAVTEEHKPRSVWGGPAVGCTGCDFIGGSWDEHPEEQS